MPKLAAGASHVLLLLPKFQFSLSFVQTPLQLLQLTPPDLYRQILASTWTWGVVELPWVSYSASRTTYPHAHRCYVGRSSATILSIHEDATMQAIQGEVEELLSENGNKIDFCRCNSKRNNHVMHVPATTKCNDQPSSSLSEQIHMGR